MAVMARETWTDERLDDLKGEMNERFDQVDKRFEQVDQRFEQVDQRFDRLDADIRELRGDVKEVQRTMVVGFIAIVVSVVGAGAF